MARSQDAEVPAVERRELGFVQALDDREHRGIHEADISIGVSLAEVSDAAKVARGQLLDVETPSDDVIEQRQTSARMKARVDEVVDLDQHRHWNHQLLGRLIDKCSASWVVSIATVERGVKHAGVED